MKPTTAVLTFLLLLGLSYWSFEGSMPSTRPDMDLPETAFSTDRAMEHVTELSKEPHAVGFPAHAKVRRYLLSQLKSLGLTPELQSGYIAGDKGSVSLSQNILARIPGTGKGKALLLLSHYDSQPHSSFGASDAGSGVATILEGIRAFRTTGKTPANDIIILFTDSEEIGLNGAELFVNAHPWVKDVGLVLNFEARGSGGPSYMLIETNRGNAKMIEGFQQANPEFPVANSLAYSVYKMLPNDTDLTVFREDGDIEGFNFAFIDDHFDYHTAMDIQPRLDPKTLAHQGSYLMPLLEYFSDADLDQMKSLNEEVYFNVPIFKLISYPFEWIWPMTAVAFLMFLLILAYGLKKKRLGFKGMVTGLLPLLITLLINGGIGYYFWPLLKSIYPQYSDILHGFTYNGYFYIAALASLALAICFWVYSRFREIPLRELLAAPVLAWLILCALLCQYLPGAAFFIIPVYGILLAWMILISQERPNPYLLVVLCIPALWIFSPFVKMFPVGLGLKMSVATSLLMTLIFYLILPVCGKYAKKSQFALAALIVFAGLFMGAHLNSGFSEDRPKPTSLLYVKNLDRDNAYWATYENSPSEWTKAYLGDQPVTPDPNELKTLSSKYSTGFTYTKAAPDKPIPAPEITVDQDTLIDGNRHLGLTISPGRDVNRLEVFTNEIPVLEASVNGAALSEYYLKNRSRSRLFTHYISNNSPSVLKLVIPAGSPLELTLYEASNNLLNSPGFSIPPRPADQIPMPFVLNDAIVLIKTLRFE
ncbi:M20/M25/M40 family metallo-hydrolase [Robiginitalea aurantiaca]|uniref:Vacuolar membrane protease n=1 Tax=Robiginitalea aurantiaca TaxID=3056915 RepID=A0ABT7WBG1_9FLAO|nr:M20/M25/M40 family metallo-hydrolase [Robiginitalea aurantiaca]MDM9630174.1 M20/M25/M40 family metallo-hydrolase [Robiginitalea aurantiaca]